MQFRRSSEGYYLIDIESEGKTATNLVADVVLIKGKTNKIFAEYPVPSLKC
jgi:hypothetical protein